MAVADRISVVTPEVIVNVQNEIFDAGHIVVRIITRTLMNEIQSNPAGVKGDAHAFFANLTNKVITQEKLEERAALDPTIRTLLDKVAAVAKTQLSQGFTGQLLMMMGIFTSEERVADFIQMQALETAKKLAEILRQKYTDGVIDQVPADEPKQILLNGQE